MLDSEANCPGVSMDVKSEEEALAVSQADSAELSAVENILETRGAGEETRHAQSKTERLSTSSSASKATKDATTRLLDFLANASNETLGACAVGLGISGYLILGRIWLIVIGVFGGAFLHATWEGSLQSDSAATSSQARRRETGTAVAERLLEWRSVNQADRSEDDEEQAKAAVDVMLSTGKLLDFAEFQPATAAALTSLSDAIIRDYVKYVPSLLKGAFDVNCILGGGIAQFSLQTTASH